MTSEELSAAGYQAVCEADEVGAPLPKLVDLEHGPILICRDDGNYYAVDAICPHENESMKFGVVFGGEITCPHHQYRFKLDSGRCNRRCAPLAVYDLEVHDGQIWVRTQQGEG